MRLSDKLNNECMHLTSYVGDEWQIEFQPCHWSSEKKTKFNEAYDIVNINNAKEVLLELSREELLELVNDILNFIKFVDVKIQD